MRFIVCGYNDTFFTDRQRWIISYDEKMGWREQAIRDKDGSVFTQDIYNMRGTSHLLKNFRISRSLRKILEQEKFLQDLR